MRDWLPGAPPSSSHASVVAQPLPNSDTTVSNGEVSVSITSDARGSGTCSVCTRSGAVELVAQVGTSWFPAPTVVPAVVPAVIGRSGSVSPAQLSSDADDAATQPGSSG